MDKQKIIEYIKQKLKEKLEMAKKSYEQSKEDISELPNRNQSRYDTMSIETSWLADGLADRMSELERDIYIIEKLKIPKETDTVMVCSIVGLRNTKTDERQEYFILPAGGGEEIMYNGSQLKVISSKSPISQSLFGKKEGEKVEVELPKGSVEYLIEHIS